MVIAKETRSGPTLVQTNAEDRPGLGEEAPSLAVSRAAAGDSTRTPAGLADIPAGAVASSDPAPHETGALERWMQRNWLTLIVASFVSTAGMALALWPLLENPTEPLWPWAPTRFSLVAAVPLVLAVLIVSLSIRQIRLSSWRRNLDEASRGTVRSLALQTEAMQQQVQELETQVEARRQVERTLQAVADTLRTQVEEEKRQTQQQSRHLHAMRHAAEMQNRRLRELHSLAHDFVNHVSHEFRTPITVIREYTHTLNDESLGTINQEQRQCLDTIMARIDDLLVMVSDLEDISRLEANILFAARRRCRADEILAGALPILERKAQASGVRLQLRDAPDLPSLYCDVDKAARALVNLGVNAIKYSETGQAVEIGLDREGEAGEIAFQVRDQGPGIPPDQVERIFRSFAQLDTNTRSSTKGFGLGLTIARELVRLNFGTVDVQSTLGSGSTFRFTLPVAAPHLLLPLIVTRARRMRPGTQRVSILVACCDEEASPGALRQVERFLQSTVRRTDSVHTAGRGRWLLLALAERDDLDRMIQRLARRWSQKEATPPLPLLQWRIAGSFDPETQIDALVSAFLALQNDPASRR